MTCKGLSLQHKFHSKPTICVLFTVNTFSVACTTLDNLDVLTRYYTPRDVNATACRLSLLSTFLELLLKHATSFMLSLPLNSAQNLKYNRLELLTNSSSKRHPSEATTPISLLISLLIKHALLRGSLANSA